MTIPGIRKTEEWPDSNQNQNNNEGTTGQECGQWVVFWGE